jgi:hypothetical protein
MTPRTDANTSLLFSDFDPTGLTRMAPEEIARIQKGLPQIPCSSCGKLVAVLVDEASAWVCPEGCPVIWVVCACPYCGQTDYWMVDGDETPGVFED